MTTVTPREIKVLAYGLLRQYGLDKLGWTFQWHNKKSCYGECYYYTKKIYISKYMFRMTLAGHRTDFLDTVKHEIAHALAHVKDNHRGHGKPWKRWAVKLGARPRASKPTNFGESLEGVKYIMVDTSNNDNIIRRYYRKPRQTVFRNIKHYSAKDRPQSLGKLKIKKVI